MMLSVFSNLLAKESDLRVIDNLCGALSRMIMANADAVPLEQVNTLGSQQLAVMHFKSFYHIVVCVIGFSCIGGSSSS